VLSLFGGLPALCSGYKRYFVLLVLLKRIIGFTKMDLILTTSVSRKSSTRAKKEIDS
tara:strand:+ start:308 stop:478 length:171 start_codon:yes stop_codon:yes gene_type:complete